MKKVAIIFISAFALTSIGVFAFATSKTKKTGTTAAETITATSINSSNENQSMTYQLVYDSSDNCTITRSTGTATSTTPKKSYFHRSINSSQMNDTGIGLWIETLPTDYEFYLLKFGNNQNPSVVNFSGGSGGPDLTVTCDCKTSLNGCSPPTEKDCDVSYMQTGNFANVTCAVKTCCSICFPPKLIKTGSIICENSFGILFMARSATMSN